MNYQQHLSLALVALGDGDEPAALAALAEAEQEAARVDPEGPRVAEVLNYVAQLHGQAGRPAEARAALERVVAIWERFPALSEGLGDYYLQLMGLCAQLEDPDAAEGWRERAHQSYRGQAKRPRR